MITKFRIVLESECAQCTQFLEDYFAFVVDNGKFPTVSEDKKEHLGQHVKGIETRRRARKWIWAEDHLDAADMRDHEPGEYP